MARGTAHNCGFLRRFEIAFATLAWPSAHLLCHSACETRLRSLKPRANSFARLARFRTANVEKPSSLGDRACKIIFNNNDLKRKGRSEKSILFQ
ncbi:hypothetical protein EHQ97_05455 [Leptospira adleri]|nr:hypothetical protein EHQ97_05455 [Leptospira adleri]